MPRFSAGEQFQIAPLSGDHDRTAFSCGSEALDRYFREQASQDIKRRVATCFVATRVGTLDVAGCWSMQRMKRRGDFMSALVFRS